MTKNRSSERGVALVIALSAALVVFFIVMAVLSLTFNRFNLSFLQADRAASFYASEAGIRYAFTRLEVDNVYSHSFTTGTGPEPVSGGFAQVVRHAFTHGASHIPARTFFVVTSIPDPPGGSANDPNVPVDGSLLAPDLRTNDLFMGSVDGSGNHLVGREVTIWIQAGGSGSVPEFRVRAFATYGN
jgi:hypothetical protein